MAGVNTGFIVNGGSGIEPKETTVWFIMGAETKLPEAGGYGIHPMITMTKKSGII